MIKSGHTSLINSEKRHLDKSLKLPKVGERFYYRDWGDVSKGYPWREAILLEEYVINYRGGHMVGDEYFVEMKVNTLGGIKTIDIEIEALNTLMKLDRETMETMHIRETWESWLKQYPGLKSKNRLTEDGLLCQEAHAAGYIEGYRKAQEENTNKEKENG
ncbi:MAG TPA: hypothetical protein ENH85_12345 [Candidatus Scalindua sp.]|nr:hypothetical protein [Candidatus Scalindua sp.]HDZ15727.1 hypothetical protein [Pricia sp.]